MKKWKWGFIETLKAMICILLPLFAGFFGGIATSTSVQTWYTTINKPFFNPPNWIFMPAWTILYILMGISLYLVWASKTKYKLKRNAILVFANQLTLNVLWSIAFFSFKSILGGFIVIIALWTVILLTIIKFYRISKPAAYLLLPYIVWVSFATILNFSVLLLNF